MNIITRLSQTDRPVWALFTDFMAFLGAIGISAYVGGFTYTSSYYQEYYIDFSIMISSEFAFSTFITEVIMSGIIPFILTLLFVAISSFVFISATTLFRPWFGYVVLSLYFCISIIVCGFVGHTTGKLDAKRNWFVEKSKLPKVTIVLNEESNLSLELKKHLSDSKDIRLLHDTGSTVVIFIPVQDDSDYSARVTYRINHRQISQVTYRN